MKVDLFTKETYLKLLKKYMKHINNNLHFTYFVDNI